MRRLLRVIALPLLLTSLAGCAGGDVSLGYGYGYANPAYPYGYYAPGYAYGFEPGFSPSYYPWYGFGEPFFEPPGLVALDRRHSHERHRGEFRGHEHGEGHFGHGVRTGRVAPPVVGSAAPPSHDLPMQYRLAIPPHAQAASPNLPPGLRLAIPQ